MENEGEIDLDGFKVIGRQNFVNLQKIDVTSKWISSGTKFPSELNKKNFEDLDEIVGLLHPVLGDLVKNIIKCWFPVQSAVLPWLIKESRIPPILPPRDIAISAPTGSGKTLCYLLPIINSLSNARPIAPFAIIIAPVQNLIKQIEEEFKKYDPFNINTALICGYNDLLSERRHLQNASVIFATSGRLMEHITDPLCAVNLRNLRYLIIDEADRMTKNARLEWLNALEFIAQYKCNFTTFDDVEHGYRMQKILVSATMSSDVDKLHEWRLRWPKLFRAHKNPQVEINMESMDLIQNSVSVPSSLKNRIIICKTQVKPLAVHVELLKRSKWKRVLIFVNSLLAGHRLTLLLKILGEGVYGTAELSSNLYGLRRNRILKRFEDGSCRVLICTDVLCRGINLSNINAVINYDLPKNVRLFIHRVGRTARCGEKGTAVSLLIGDEIASFKEICMKAGCTKTKETNFEVNNDDLNQKYQRSLLSLKNIVIKKGKSTPRNKTHKNRVKKAS